MVVAAYHGLVCAVYSVRFSMCREVRGLEIAVCIDIRPVGAELF